VPAAPATTLVDARCADLRAGRGGDDQRPGGNDAWRMRSVTRRGRALIVLKSPTLSGVLPEYPTGCRTAARTGDHDSVPAVVVTREVGDGDRLGHSHRDHLPESSWLDEAVEGPHAPDADQDADYEVTGHAVLLNGKCVPDPAAGSGR